MTHSKEDPSTEEHRELPRSADGRAGQVLHPERLHRVRSSSTRSSIAALAPGLKPCRRRAGPSPDEAAHDARAAHEHHGHEARVAPQPERGETWLGGERGRGVGDSRLVFPEAPHAGLLNSIASPSRCRAGGLAGRSAAHAAPPRADERAESTGRGPLLRGVLRQPGHCGEGRDSGAVCTTTCNTPTWCRCTTTASATTSRPPTPATSRGTKPPEQAQSAPQRHLTKRTVAHVQQLAGATCRCARGGAHGRSARVIQAQGAAGQTEGARASQAARSDHVDDRPLRPQPRLAAEELLESFRAPRETKAAHAGTAPRAREIARAPGSRTLNRRGGAPGVGGDSGGNT